MYKNIIRMRLISKYLRFNFTNKISLLMVHALYLTYSVIIQVCMYIIPAANIKSGRLSSQTYFIKVDCIDRLDVKNNCLSKYYIDNYLQQCIRLYYS